MNEPFDTRPPRDWSLVIVTVMIVLALAFLWRVT